jgi:HD-like signal output (HDOD) protein
MARDANLRRRLERRIESLPVLPAVASKVMALDRSEANYFDKLRVLVESDPSYVARILAIANSAADAPRARITSVRRALMRLGSSKASSTIFTLAMSKVFVPQNDWEKSLWRHSLQVAVALRTLVQSSPTANMRIDEAYTAGLLHDVGRFVLFGENPAFLRRVDEHDWSTIEELMELERTICGLTHEEVGAIACEQWRLPEPLVSVARKHHSDDLQPNDGEVESLTVAVRFADFAMNPAARPGTSGYEAADLETIERELVPRLPPFFDFDAASLQVILHSIARETDDVCSVIGLT